MAGRRNSTLESLMSFEFVGLCGLDTAHIQPELRALDLGSNAQNPFRLLSPQHGPLALLCFSSKSLKKEKVLDLIQPRNDEENKSRTWK